MDSKHTKRTATCKEAGIKFREYMINIGEGLGDEDKIDLQDWSDKDAITFFIENLKNRRREYSQDNPSAESDNEQDNEKGKHEKSDSPHTNIIF